MVEIFDPFAVETRREIYARYRTLRDSFPVYYNAERDFYALARYEDVQAASRDWMTFSTAGGVDLDNTGRDITGVGNFLELDPPRHDLLRAVVRRNFSPKSVGELESLVHAEVTELLDAFADRGTTDLSVEFASRLPVRVVSTILGIPHADRDAMGALFRRSFSREVGVADIPDDAHAAARRLHEYFGDLALARERNPQDDVISLIAGAKVDGERLRDEVTGMCVLIFVAAIDTTSSFIANALHVLAETPDQRAYLWADTAARMPRAIEELLRFITPVQNLMRTTTVDVTVGDQVIPQGKRVLLLYASANRDERVFERPDELDLARAARRNLAFGDGIHFCLGAHLARLEARVALSEVARRIPDYTIAGPVAQSYKQNERNLTTLPVAFSVGSKAQKPATDGARASIASSVRG